MTVDRSTSCGLFSWRPSWLQRLATPTVYLGLTSLVSIFQTMLFSYFSVVLSTIEKRFGLKSREAAWLYSGNEISQILFIFFLPFVGRVKRRPLILSLTIMLCAIGCLLIALPHFFGDEADLAARGYSSGSSKQSTSGDSNLCLNDPDGSSRASQCVGSDDSVKDWPSIITIFIGILLIGIGVSFFYALGVPYADDNVKRKNSPMLLSVIMASRSAGPALGYVVGALCLKVYRNWQETPDFDEDDPRWIGGWWIGFLLVAFLLTLSVPWISCFPGRLPLKNTDAHEIAKAEARGEDDTPETVKEWMQELLGVLKRLFMNKIWLMNLLSTIFVIMGFISVATFFPKYIEYHFRQRASTAGGLGGLSKTIAAVVGMITSGLLISKFRFGAKTLAGYCAFSTLIGSLSLLSVTLLPCPKLEFYGLQTTAGSSPLGSALGTTFSCQTNCHCDEVTYHPVCSTDGVTNFFSPCHAGCLWRNETLDKKDKKKGLYFDCSCVKENSRQTLLPVAKPWWKKVEHEDKELPNPVVSGGFSSSSSAPKTLSGAVEGYCPENCNLLFAVLLGILFVSGVIGAGSRVPNALLNLRLVDKRDKTSALTLTVSLLSLLAFLPGPILYGWVIDSTCIIWDEKCGQTTNCLVYDTDQMRLYFGLLAGFFVFLAFLCDLGVFFMVGDLKIYDDEDEDSLSNKGMDLSDRREDSGFDSHHKDDLNSNGMTEIELRETDDRTTEKGKASVFA